MDIAGLIPASRNVEGIVEMMLDATQKFSKPLTEKRLFDWNAALFPTGRSGMHSIIVGHWHNDESAPMQVVSGPIGREKVHFEAPSADNILDRFYSLSTQLASERKDYFNQLERQQKSTPEITGWLEWFLDCLGRAISNAEESLGKVLFKAKLWDKVNQHPLNDRQCFIINRMLEDNYVGHMNTSKYAKLAKCSTDTALRDIQGLISREIFMQNPEGAGMNGTTLREFIAHSIASPT